MEEFPAKLSIGKEAISAIVEQTICELGDPEERVVTLKQYSKMVYENNEIVKWLAVDLERVEAQALQIVRAKGNFQFEE